MTEKIVFMIGTDVNGGCSECQMVLEYSIKKHCSVPYEIHWMKISDDPKSFWNGWYTENWSTPFSGFRYGIPEYLGFKGKAIYQDDDQLWLTDPKELWDIEIEDPYIMTGKKLSNGEVRHCVSLWDNEKAKNVLPPVSRRKSNPNFVNSMKSLTFPRTQIIDRNFNNYDGEDQDIKDIKLLHFTSMDQNPGVKLAVKRLGSQAQHWYDGPIRPHRRPEIEQVFYQYYEEALADGFSVADYVPNRKVDYAKGSQKGFKANNGWDT